MDQRVLLPEAWLTDASAARRARGKVPTAGTLQSQPPWAAAMVQAIVHAGLRPCKYVVADGLYGHSPDVRDAVDACVGVTTCVAMPSETRCWLPRPRTEDKTSTDTGAVRSKRGMVAPANAPSAGAALAASLPASHWSQRTVSEGTQGPMASAVARQRVTLCQEGLPGRTGWLVIKRTVGVNPVYSYSISHAPARTPVRTFVWLSGVRWAIEHCFEEGKTALGMDHDAVRTYPGWHHQMLPTMLGFFAQPLEMVYEGNEAEQHVISNRIRRVCHDSTREVS